MILEIVSLAVIEQSQIYKYPADFNSNDNPFDKSLQIPCK